MKDLRITGVKVAYYFVCPTKLWLFSHNISMEHESDYVQIGKLIHETSYKGRDGVNIDEIAIDFIKRGDVIEVHEVKKARSIEEAHKMQLLYYLYYLKKKGIKAVGYIDYPKLRKREYLELNPDYERKIEFVLQDIKRIIEGKMPAPVFKRICRKCAYAEFCFAEVEE